MSMKTPFDGDWTDLDYDRFTPTAQKRDVTKLYRAIRKKRLRELEAQIRHARYIRRKAVRGW